jgi:xanthine dehydrogenase YagR molybdenum-binding subunit
MGNGARSVIARALASAFQIEPHQVLVHIGDSSAPRGPLSGGSRTTNSVYHPTVAAAQELQKLLRAAAMSELGLRDATIVPGGVQSSSGHLPWLQLAQRVSPQRAVAARGKDKGLPAMPLAIGADDLVTGRGFTGSVHVTAVEVDTRLGKIKPLHVWGGLAAGRIHVPELARSQCQGAIIQGIGLALYEERHLDASGHVLNANLEDYRIPGIGDVPEIEMHFHEEGFEHAMGGGVGLSELATLGVAASVGNAVFHATGRRFHSAPILPAHIIAGGSP